MCSVPVYVSALETMTLTVKQQEEESWEFIKRVDKGRMVEMRMEVGVKESFKKKWEMKNWQKADAQKVKQKRRRGRPKLRWRIALNDLERVILEKNGEKEEQIEGICDC